MSRRRGHTNLALALLTAASLTAAAVQQLVLVRVLSTRHGSRRSAVRGQAPSPRWTGGLPGGGISPVLPQHPHAPTAGGSRRAHIV